MSDDKVVETELGTASELTMDSFIRTLISQMFDNDNEVGTLSAVLEGNGDKDDPEIEIEIRLKSINGVAIGEENDG